MATIAEVRLPDDVERGASGGPRFHTRILTLYSGHERRNQEWSDARGEWDISYGIQNRNDLHRVLRFFYARRGRFQGFRFKDWSDYEAADALFGVGDGTTKIFQLYKPYNDDLNLNLYSRAITKPVSGAVAVKVAGVATAAFTLNYTTGLLTFTTAPSAAAALTWTGEFDVPVRFDVDQLDLTMERFDAGEIPAINIVELR
jgi:uncharacterized protein (TIGR02217 family)